MVEELGAACKGREWGHGETELVYCRNPGGLFDKVMNPLREIREMKMLTTTLAAALIVLPLTAAAQNGGQYADINGLHMYYEVHGKGEPVVLLHGAFLTAESWGAISEGLAKTRQVILVELEGHGHTKDLDRDLSADQMANDVDGLIKHLGFKKVDVLGYSMGGEVTLSLVVHHPESVRRAVVIGAAAGPTKETFDPVSYQILSGITPENFPVLDDYKKVAPDPSRWPILVKKVISMSVGFPGFSADQLKGITSEVLLMGGDRDGVRAEALLATYRAIPGAQLAIVPGTDHFLPLLSPEKVLANALPFLDGVKPPTMSGG